MKATIILSVLAAVVSASPLGKRAVFSSTTFDDISIAGGTAGNAQEEAQQALSGLPTDLTQVDAADLDFLNEVNQVANDAETDAFNPAIDAASGEEADALQVSAQPCHPKARVWQTKQELIILTFGTKTARQDQEQGAQADGDGHEARGTTGTGRGRGG